MQPPAFGMGTPGYTSADMTPTFASDKRKRPASPVSTLEVADTRSSHKRRLATFARTSSKLGETESLLSALQRPHMQLRRQSSRATSEFNQDASIIDRNPEGRGLRKLSDHEAQSSRPATPGSSQDPAAVTEILSPTSTALREYSFQESCSTIDGSQVEDPDTPLVWLREGAAGTPLRDRAASSIGGDTPSSGKGRSRVRARPSVLDTAAAQDISLPSPRLSPVTAAANLQTRRDYFDDDTLGNADFDHPRPSGVGVRRNEISPATTDGSQDSAVPRAERQFYPQAGLTNSSSSTPSMMDIPTMLDCFEAMPAEMKTYVMYQLLRRCPKPVLQFVGDTVNPALKCDFLSLLPLELSLNIVGRLDVKSLCSAAQVSIKWRQIIDSGEDAWRRLCEADGYHVTDDEVRRAIIEGWGWQHPTGLGDWEKDIGTKTAISEGDKFNATSYSEVTRGAPGFVSPGGTQEASASTSVKRTKRKAAPKPKLKARRPQKTTEVGTVSGSSHGLEAWMNSSIDGPYAAARAASAYVPCPQLGLPRLRNLHLFKSIYQRHHSISKSWMHDETKPRHIAFRAHQRHVVTCLQFDTDKILTGSDDNHINVYDTQTGALRARLEGHDGGVWALQYLGNVLVSGSTDRSVRVWDIEKGVCTQVFQGHTSTVRCLQILMPTAIKTSDGKIIVMPKEPLIITGSRDSNLRVWKLPTPNESSASEGGQAQDDTTCPYFVRVLNGHSHSVRAIAAHGDTLVSGSYDSTVRVWKISTGETLHRLQGHTQKVYSVVLDHERNRCISGSMDNLVKVWSLDTGSLLFNLDGHASLVGLLDLREDRLVSAAADSTLRIWDPEYGQCKSVLTAHTGAITCFQHDGRKVISGSDRTLKMWNMENGHFVKDLLTDLSGVWQVKFDERRCVAAVQRNNITYIEVCGYLSLLVRKVLIFCSIGSRLWCIKRWNTGTQTRKTDRCQHRRTRDLGTP